jgi:hypothetical protein
MTNVPRNPKNLNTSRLRNALEMRALWRHVEHELRFLGDLDAKSGKDAILLYVRPRWWLRALGLGRWAERRAMTRAMSILYRARPDTVFKQGRKS